MRSTVSEEAFAEMNDAVTHVIDRIEDGWTKEVECGPGWTNLVIGCHLELMMIDPDYTVYQVKEKFGSLRYYFGTKKDDEDEAKMWEIAKKYEMESMKTCELTGEQGTLMVKDGRYKTLSEQFAKDGWQEVD
jgi:hypothetical protein